MGLFARRLVAPLEALFSPFQVPPLFRVLEGLTRVAVVAPRPPIAAPLSVTAVSLAWRLGRALRFFL
jgi:hypothetical protein